MPFEKIHNTFCKYILGVHKKSSNFAAKCELGRKPVLNFITILALKYFNRLKQLPSDRLLGEIYEVDKSKVLKLASLKFAECLYTYLRGAYYPDFYFQQFFTVVKSNVSFSSYSLGLKKPSLAVSTNWSFSFNLNIINVCH